MGKVKLLSTGKVWKTQKFPIFFATLQDLELMRNHALPNLWECANSHKEMFCGKPYQS